MKAKSPFQPIRTAFEIFILFACAAVTLATSGEGDSASTRKYGMAGNCPYATTNNVEITVTGSSITSPTGVTFKNLGLPVETMSVGQANVSGEISPGITRTCTYSMYTSGSDTLDLYSCVDSNGPTCQVSFTRL